MVRDALPPLVPLAESTRVDGVPLPGCRRSATEWSIVLADTSWTGTGAWRRTPDAGGLLSPTVE